MNPPPAESSPTISVVIASVNGLPSIVECLDCLSQQEGNIGYEVLVMDRCDAKTRQEIRRRFLQPEIELVEVPGRPSIPKLRAMGIARARGQLIAILEDHCNVPLGWFRGIIRSHEAGYKVMSGPVENAAVNRIVDWAVYFCEYARFMPPISAVVVGEIGGDFEDYTQVAGCFVGPGACAED